MKRGSWRKTRWLEYFLLLFFRNIFPPLSRGFAWHRLDASDVSNILSTKRHIFYRFHFQSNLPSTELCLCPRKLVDKESFQTSWMANSCQRYWFSWTSYREEVYIYSRKKVWRHSEILMAKSQPVKPSNPNPRVGRNFVLFFSHLVCFCCWCKKVVRQNRCICTTQNRFFQG